MVAARVEVGAERPWLWSRFQLQHTKCVAYHEHIHIYHLLQETNKGLHVLMQYPQCICLMRNIRINKFENIINMSMSPSTIFSSSTVYSCMMLEDTSPRPAITLGVPDKSASDSKLSHSKWATCGKLN